MPTLASRSFASIKYSTDSRIVHNMAARGYDWVAFGRRRCFSTQYAMILNTVLTTLRQHDAIALGELVIVAVSGGSDSVALLHLLIRLKDALGIDLHVASLDHGLRAEAGQLDLKLVAGLAARSRLPYTLGHVDVPGLSAEWGIGIEAAARRARYAFLAQVAREQGARRVAVGHHALDQAETILMNIVRGTGARGLRGMQVLSDMPQHAGIRLVRPLLSIAKRELEMYCHERKLPFRVDESNADIRFRRNFLRQEVIPKLKRLNPDALAAFERLAESAAVDEDFLAEQVERTVMPLATVKSDRWQMRIADFAALHPALQRRFLQSAFRQFSGGSDALSHALTLDLIAWSREAATGSRRDITGALQLRVSYDALFIERKDAVDEQDQYRLIPIETDEPLRLGNPIALQGLTIGLSPGGSCGGEGVELRLPACAALRLRTRRPGDRFKPKGMGGRSRKIKDWMIDRKIPREIRDRIPLICADDAIIAICWGETWHLADVDLDGLRDADVVTLTLA